MLINVDQFVERLTASGLMSAAELSNFQDSLPPEQRPRDVKGLVTVLYRAGKLTKYQAKAIHEGQGKSLVFDEYVVTDKIGEGGMGVVLKAQHRRMKRTVAIKVLPAAKVNSPDARERFYREVEAVAKLSHPNIVAAHDAREHEGTLCLVMEFVEGHDLAAVIKEHGAIPVAQAIDCIIQAARGLQYAHSKGIVHRDIKPANLLLDKEGVVKILDLGLARIAGAEAILGDDADRLTATGQVMGTGEYMAPEQAFDIRHADHRADIYSLGCTLYRLLTRHAPYRGELLMQVLLAHRESPIPSLRSARPEVPEDLDECFQRMVAKKPEDRYQSMAEVVSALESVVMSMSGKLAPIADSPGEAFSKNWAFLQDASIPGAIVKRKKSQALDHTIAYHSPEQDTAPGLAGKARATIIRMGSMRLMLAGLAGIAIVLLAVILVVLGMRQGTQQVAGDEKLAKDVQPSPPAPGATDAQPKPSGKAKAESNFKLSDKPTVENPIAPAPMPPKLSEPTPAPPEVAVAPAPAAENPIAVKPAADLPETKEPAAKESAEAPAGAPAAKLDPPSADDQKRLIAEIDDAYSTAEAKDPAAKIALALRLLEEGNKTTTDRAKQFTLFRRAGELACGAGESDVMVQAVDAIATAGFNIQPYQVKARLLKRLVEQHATDGADELSTVSAACVRFAEDAAANGAVDEAFDVLMADTKSLVEPSKRAQSASRVAQVAVNRARNPADKTEREKKAEEAQGSLDTIKAAQSALADCGKDLQQARHEQAIFLAAQTRLEATPDDPDACLAVGRYLCFSRGDWEQGLKLLAEGNDAALKSLAAAEIASTPSTADEKVARGDAWWGLAEKATGKSKAGMRRRANYWYQAAIKDLPTGVAKSKIEKRLAEPLPTAESKPAASRPPLALAPFNEKTAKTLQGRWAKYLHVPVAQTNSIGMKLVLIPPGEFDMGSTKDIVEHDWGTYSEQFYSPLAAGETPRHRVRITKPFWMAVAPVTQEEFQRIMGKNPSKFAGEPKRPVEQVSWDDATEFCRKLSELPGEKAAKRRYVLPTEAQWEFASRAGNPYHWFFSPQPGLPKDDVAKKVISEFAWSNANAADQTHAVGQKLPNPWGLYDLYGNVWQWCQDWYDLDYYAKSPQEDPQGPPGGAGRTMRGGCWQHSYWICRSATRQGMDAGRRLEMIGFRVSVLVGE